MLIYMQNPSASLCAGFNTWKNKKGMLKPAEKGLKNSCANYGNCTA